MGKDIKPNERLSKESLDELYDKCLEMSRKGKININNAFDLTLIDHLSYMFEKGKPAKDGQPATVMDTDEFYRATNGYDMGSKIYDLRVTRAFRDTYATWHMALNSGPKKQDTEPVDEATLKQTREKQWSAALLKLPTLQVEVDSLIDGIGGRKIPYDPFFSHVGRILDASGSKGSLSNTMPEDRNGQKLMDGSDPWDARTNELELPLTFDEELIPSDLQKLPVLVPEYHKALDHCRHNMLDDEWYLDNGQLDLPGGDKENAGSEAPFSPEPEPPSEDGNDEFDYIPPPVDEHPDAEDQLRQLGIEQWGLGDHFQTPGDRFFHRQLEAIMNADPSHIFEKPPSPKSGNQERTAKPMDPGSLKRKFETVKPDSPKSDLERNLISGSLVLDQAVPATVPKRPKAKATGPSPPAMVETYTRGTFGISDRDVVHNLESLLLRDDARVVRGPDGTISHRFAEHSTSVDIFARSACCREVLPLHFQQCLEDVFLMEGREAMVKMAKYFGPTLALARPNVRIEDFSYGEVGNLLLDAGGIARGHGYGEPGVPQFFQSSGDLGDPVEYGEDIPEHEGRLDLFSEIDARRWAEEHYHTFQDEPDTPVDAGNMEDFSDVYSSDDDQLFMQTTEGFDAVSYSVSNKFVDVKLVMSAINQIIDEMDADVPLSFTTILQKCRHRMRAKGVPTGNVSVYFVCLLYLCNEKSLRLERPKDMNLFWTLCKDSDITPELCNLGYFMDAPRGDFLVKPAKLENTE